MRNAATARERDAMVHAIVFGERAKVEDLATQVNINAFDDKERHTLAHQWASRLLTFTKKELAWERFDRCRDTLTAACTHGLDLNRALPNLRTPLLFAISLALDVDQRDRVVELLLDLGADPRFGDCSGYTPLHFAHQLTEQSLQRIIRAGADLNAPTIHGYTPLHLALGHRDSKAADILLDSGASPRPPFPPPLLVHEAVAAHTLSMVQRLLAAGESVHEPDRLGRTPLHRARQTSMIEFLLERGADVNARDRAGHTPLADLVRSDPGHLEAITAHVQAGSDLAAPLRDRPLTVGGALSALARDKTYRHRDGMRALLARRAAADAVLHHQRHHQPPHQPPAALARAVPPGVA